MAFTSELPTRVGCKFHKGQRGESKGKGCTLADCVPGCGVPQKLHPADCCFITLSPGASMTGRSSVFFTRIASQKTISVHLQGKRATLLRGQLLAVSAMASRKGRWVEQGLEPKLQALEPCSHHCPTLPFR